ncbi:restriction endonuclease subunit S [Stutzerimonas nitrititolerans]|uniref:restriction endonuclease subunit S n=1 Tax=Stutzerimonas nitrititolerans TaxID=2482751 RepID=UPI0028B06007|nr:restriction endonuclease subunit S [Stutzerimonas nitrititolerans]
MTNRPSCWAAATLGDLCSKPDQRIPDIDESFTYIEIASIDRDKKVISEPQYLLGIDAPSRARKIVKKGDVIVSMTRPNLNAVALVGKSHHDCIASTGFDVLRPIEVEPRWIFATVRSGQFVDAMCEKAQGALYPSVKATDIRSYKLPLPPLAEQSYIAQQLDHFFEKVDILKSRISSLSALHKRFRQSVITAAVSGQLTEDWRESYNSSETAEQQVAKIEKLKSGRLKIRKTDIHIESDELFAIPKGWSWIENHRLAEDKNTAICAGPFGTIFKAKDFRDNGIPIIFLRHIGEGVYKTEKPGFMDEIVWKNSHQEYSVYGGELLVTKLGDPPGTACIYPTGIGTAMVTPDVIKMSVDERVASARYLMYFFNSLQCKELIKKLAFGATRLRIDIAMFKSFPIPLPPLAEQLEIVRRVEHLLTFSDQLQAKIYSAKKHIDRLPQSILNKAFSGELSIDWRNANPELINGSNSAEALLAKIKALPGAKKKATNSRQAGNQKMAITNKLTKDELKAWILKRNEPAFSFNELNSALNTDYDQLKDCLFDALTDKNPILKQEFDETAGQIIFVKVQK